MNKKLAFAALFALSTLAHAQQVCIDVDKSTGVAVEKDVVYSSPRMGLGDNLYPLASTVAQSLAQDYCKQKGHTSARSFEAAAPDNSDAGCNQGYPVAAVTGTDVSNCVHVTIGQVQFPGALLVTKITCR